MLLSICMPTLNRAAFIGATLDSIVPQLAEDMEVVVVDGGSKDGTADVVGQRSAVCPRIRYFLSSHESGGAPKPSNAGYDRDCDQAVGLASGSYCWLLPDDDLLVPDALSRIRRYLETGVALVIANAEVRSNDLSRVLAQQRLRIPGDLSFERGEGDRILTATGGYLSYAGAVVVRRDWWLCRNRERYYGSGFVHMGTLFQDPSDLDAVVVAQPLIQLRYGNALWSSRAFDIWMLNWPELIWSFPISEAAKAAVVPREPWRSLRTLAFQRARGFYGLKEYRRLVERNGLEWRARWGALAVAATPGFLIHLTAMLKALLSGQRHTAGFDDLWRSPHNVFGRMKSRRALAP